MATAMAIGNITGIQQLYDTAHKTANDNTKTNAERREAVLDCYGDIIQQQMPEVYYVGNFSVNSTQGYAYNAGDGATAEQVCGSLGGRVATLMEVSEAQKAGAQWCASGMVSNNGYKMAVYPMQDTLQSGCGSAGVNKFVSDTGQVGINCYGPKPAQLQGQSTSNILPFTAPIPGGVVVQPGLNSGQTLWNQPY
jgi:hypothetical protein